jgi:BirA family transcriptional regulator, biotin operon repressor / biotin---[acetyl-CoA-carboxylase] ligase
VFDLSRLRDGLRPTRLHFCSHVRSTSDQAALLRRRGRLFAPAVVLTPHQTAGRGRGKNSWWSNHDVLTATFVLGIEEGHSPSELPLIAGLAVRDAAAELTGHTDIELKWPNDVLLAGRKLAGLLCERIEKADLVGIGLNVNLDPTSAPKSLRPTITSLSAISGRNHDMTAVLLLVASQLRQAILRRRRQPFGQFIRQYERHHALIGRKVIVTGEHSSPPICGIVEGIDHQARLVVRDQAKLHRITAGQVILA